MNLRQKILRLLVALTLSITARPSVRADEPGIQRYLVGSLHTFGDFHAKQGQTNFHAAVEQGVFVYDINVCHKLAKKFPAKAWTSWRGGWAGLAAHAGSGVLFQVQDGSAIRAYDFLGEKLLWETSAQKGSKEQDADTRKVVTKLNGLNEASIEIQVKDGKVIRTGHDGGSGLDTWCEGYELPAK